MVAAHQPAHPRPARHAPVDVAGGDRPLVVVPHQPAGLVAAGHVHRPQPQVAQHAARPQPLEQAHLVGAGPHDGKIGNRVAVAVEGPRIRPADRVPARAVIPVGRADRAEVQVEGQLVAGTARGQAAHTRCRVGEGHRVARIGGYAVAIQIPADGVQLGQAGDLNQAVVVRVVVNEARRHRNRRRGRAGPDDVDRADGQLIRRAVGEARDGNGCGPRLTRGTVGDVRPGSRRSAAPGV